MGAARTGRRLAVAATVLITVLVAAPVASAFTAPEVFLKEEDASNQPVGNWIPLSGATMHSVNRYDIGVRIQDPAGQRVLVQVNSVPGSAMPTQPDIYSLCFVATGSVGDIADTQEDVRYQGDGAYSLSVTLAPPTGDASHGCTSGPSTTATFTASAPTGIQFVGRMVTSDPTRTDPFGGIAVEPAFGSGGTEIICARQPRPLPDGTLTGSLVVRQEGDGYLEPRWTMHASALFERPGRYACVARSVGGGEMPGPWSAPTPAKDVQTGFYPQAGSWRITKAFGPVYRLTGRISSPLSAGGTLHVVIKRIDKRATAVRLQTRVRAGAGVSMSFRLPPTVYNGFPPSFAMSFSFGGTRFVAARAQFVAFGFRLLPVRAGNQLQFSGACSPFRC
jgi:hypothetical protein